MNPRDTAANMNRRRMIRRGATYGSYLPEGTPDDGSERGIAWRAADSLSLRDFLGLPASKRTPDHSTISRTRRLLDLETHQAVFSWALGVLDSAGLIKGKTIGTFDAELAREFFGGFAASALINLRQDFGNPYHGEAQGFDANPKALPPKDTPVKLLEALGK